MMSIAQALKARKRLSGQIADLQRKILSSNRYTSSRPALYDAAALLEELRGKQRELLDLKARIAKANVGIQHDLILLSEMKGLAAFFNQLVQHSDVKERVENEWRGGAQVEVTNFSNIDREHADAYLADAQRVIDDTQDRVDNYNATTQI